MVHASKLIRQHVAICLQRQLFKEFLSRMWKIVKCNATEAKLEKMSEEEDRTTWPLQKDGKLKWKQAGKTQTHINFLGGVGGVGRRYTSSENR